MRDFTTKELLNNLTEDEVKKTQLKEFSTGIQPLVTQFVEGVDSVAKRYDIETSYFVDVIVIVKKMPNISSSVVATDLDPYGFSMLGESLALYRQFQREAKEGDPNEFLGMLPSKSQLLKLVASLRHTAEHVTELAGLASAIEDCEQG